MKIFKKYIFLSMIIFLALASCMDDELYTPGGIPAGESDIAAAVSFPAFAPALEGRAGGAPGNAIKNIDTLWLLIYEKDENGAWTLEKGGKILLDKNLHNLSIDTQDKARPDNTEQGEARTAGASFRLRHKNGVYKIFAVANCDLSAVDDADVATPEKLSAMKLSWDSGNVGNNAEMFGCFTNDRKLGASTDETVIISPNRTIHSWMHRAASKLTVAFDTRGLKKDIQIYIKSVTLKDIPAECYLGEQNTPSATRQGISNELIDGDILYFGNASSGSTDHTQWRMLTKETGIWGFRSEQEHASALPPDATGQQVMQRRAWEHEEAANALYFYENMQGKGKDKAQTAPGPDNDNGTKPGIGFQHPDQNVDDSGWKDNKPYGSYVEVEAYYISKAPGNVSRGTIKYRFMLGKDTHTDYNAERNFHYKLTLVFKGNANETDWHIEYKERVLEVSQPKIFNYQGKVFMPDINVLNRDHTFSPDNLVTVTSYEGNVGEPETFREFSVSFREKGQDKFTDQCDWIHWSVDELNSTQWQKVLKFNADTAYTIIDIDQALTNATPKGSAGSPYNLANPGGGTNYVKCTANCYMIDAPGDYILPLVYGNSLHNGATNENSYKFSGSVGSQYLANFKNHLNNGISNPYIAKNEGCAPASAELVWQDEENLVTGVTYDATAFNKMGGLRFHVDKSTIKQGNATVAIKDTQGRVMWSWHLWVTRLDVEPHDKTIEVTAFDKNRKFDLMPVNLGWCSEHGAKIRYHRRRECDVLITSGELTDTIKIIQESHMAFPRGNNPYYQWGRKDPFIGSLEPFANKPRWDGTGKYYPQWSPENNPPRLTDDSTDSMAQFRPTTRNALHLLIQNPEKFHNPPRKAGTTTPWVSDNETYFNLWEGRRGVDPTAPTLKTVYDPCPVGYQVNHYNAFTGFTTTGDNTNFAPEWYDVRLENIANGNPKDYLYEFYTDTLKVRSIIFPETGYRDWDDRAYVYQMNLIGYIWAAGNFNNDDNNSYNFEFSRGGGYVRPQNRYFPCDGFPVRPCVYDKHGTDLE